VRYLDTHSPALHAPALVTKLNLVTHFHAKLHFASPPRMVLKTHSNPKLI